MCNSLLGPHPLHKGPGQQAAGGEASTAVDVICDTNVKTIQSGSSEKKLVMDVLEMSVLNEVWLQSSWRGNRQIATKQGVQEKMAKLKGQWRIYRGEGG